MDNIEAWNIYFDYDLILRNLKIDDLAKLISLEILSFKKKWPLRKDFYMSLICIKKIEKNLNGFYNNEHLKRDSPINFVSKETDSQNTHKKKNFHILKIINSDSTGMKTL